MKYYDPEEGFEIDLEKAYQIDRLSYKGILVQYIEDTNTVIFTKQNNNPNYNYKDEDDIETIVYRNYSVEEIKEYIDIDLRVWWEDCYEYSE